MSYLFTFLPWIVYAVLGGHSAASQQRGTLAAFAVTVLVIVYKRRTGNAFDALIIETGSAAFFAAIAAIAFAAPHSGLLTYTAALSNTTLAVIAWASLAVRRPFTLGIAKQTMPREAWTHPAFIHANDVITTLWAGSFTVSAAILMAVIHAGADVFVLATIQVLGFVVPMVATARYVKIAHARAQHGVGNIPPGVPVQPLSSASMPSRGGQAFPLELVRAITLTWLFSGQRSDEFAGLCAREPGGTQVHEQLRCPTLCSDISLRAANDSMDRSHFGGLNAPIPAPAGSRRGRGIRRHERAGDPYRLHRRGRLGPGG